MDFANAACMYAYTLASSFAPDASSVHKSAFLLTSGAVLFAGSLVLALLLRPPGSVSAGFGTGALAGSLIFTGGYCTLLALSNAGVPGHVIYPATTGGSNVLVVALSVVLLKERPGWFGWAGIAVGTVALVMLGAAA